MRHFNPNSVSVSTSMFARALATENIFVSFDDGAKTATFNLESRVLTLPNWKVSDILRDMLVAHEVAHALFTPPEVHMKAIADAEARKLHKRGYQACLNVIEDARIERLIKERFPGCRRDFYAGYKEILALDIFKINGADLAEVSIVDKINLYFKFGTFGLLNVPISAGEQRIIDRVQVAKTYDDVVAIANDLYEMFEDECKKKNKKMTGDGGEGGAADKLGQDLGEAMSDKSGDGRGKTKTQTPPFPSYAIPKANSGKAIISYRKILAEADHRIAEFQRDTDNYAEYQNIVPLIDSSYEKFRSETSGMVRELVMQFERRKAAEEVRNERQKPSGNINPDRLHQFRTHDDIFLRNLIKHEGKKHGMVMLIDWSGSMAEGLDGVVRQVLLLTWFCRKIKVPYEVYLYTDAGFLHADPSNGEQKQFQELASLFSPVKAANTFDFAPVHLRQVFTNTMTDEEHDRVAKMLWAKAMTCDRDAFVNAPDLRNASYTLSYSLPQVFNMNSTPTIEALMVMHDYLPKFREASNVDIVNFMFVTDGEPNGLGKHGPCAYETVAGMRIQHLPTGRTLTVKSTPHDQYLGSLNLHLQYFMAEEIQKLGVTTIGFSIGGMSGIGQHYLNRLVRPLTNFYARKDGESNLDFMRRIDAADKKFNDFYKKENFITASGDLVRGFHEYYVMRPVKPNTEDANIEKGATLTKIRNQFVKALTGRKCSRVFLSRFVDILAGRKVQKFKPVV